MRYQFIDTYKKTWPVRLMCQVLNVSSSGYYDWRRRPVSEQAQSNRVLDGQIRQIYDEHKQRYGCPGITDELKDRGFQCSENRVARRMSRLGLKGIQAKKFKRTTDSKHDKRVAQQLMCDALTMALFRRGFCRGA